MTRKVIVFLALIALQVVVINSAWPAVSVVPMGSFGRGPSNAPGEFNYPSGIAVDSGNGDVFVMDLKFHRVQRFDADGNYITQWHVPGGPGLTVDSVEHSVYVAVPGTDRVYKYTADGQLVWTIGTTGAGNGQFDKPRDVAVDPVSRDVFVLDSSNKRVQRFSPDGAFISAWTDSSLLGPQAIAIDPTGQFIYVTNSHAEHVNKYDMSGHLLLTWGGLGDDPGKFRWPRGVAVNAQGIVYVADADKERLQVFDANGNFLRIMQGPHNDQQGPFHPRAVDVNTTTGDIYAAASYAHRVDRFYPDGTYRASWGHHEKDGPVFNRPRGVAISPVTGEILVSDTDNHVIKKFSPTGAFLTQFGTTPFVHRDETALMFPQWMAFDSAGLVWINTGGLLYPDNPCWGSPKSVRRFDSYGIYYSGFATNKFAIDKGGIAVDSVHNAIYLVNPPYDEVMVFDWAGNLLFTFGTKGTGPGQFHTPAGIALDLQNQALYVVDSGNQRVSKFDLSGNFLQSFGTPGSGPGQFHLGPASGIAIDNFGDLYVADIANHRIEVFGLDGTYVSEVHFSPGYPTGLAVNGTTLVAANTGSNRIDIFKIVPSVADPSSLQAQ